MKKITLENWIIGNELSIDAVDMQFVEPLLKTEGVVVECDDSATDWEFWCGDGVMIETNPTGTRVVHSGSYSVTTRIGYYNLRECHDGMTPEETSLYIEGLDSPVYAVRDEMTDRSIYIQSIANIGHHYIGPFQDEKSARTYWAEHQTTNIVTKFVPASELPVVFGSESIGTLIGPGLSANAMNFLTEIVST